MRRPQPELSLISKLRSFLKAHPTVCPGTSLERRRPPSLLAADPSKLAPHIICRAQRRSVTPCSPMAIRSMTRAASILPSSTTANSGAQTVHERRPRATRYLRRRRRESRHGGEWPVSDGPPIERSCGSLNAGSAASVTRPAESLRGPPPRRLAQFVVGVTDEAQGWDEWADQCGHFKSARVASSD